tara:strand:- start:99 stop:311 length:213 start_codon:yes stop_codon:yes gene_type:complete
MDNSRQSRGGRIESMTEGIIYIVAGVIALIIGYYMVNWLETGHQEVDGETLDRIRKDRENVDKSNQGGRS